MTFETHSKHISLSLFLFSVKRPLGSDRNRLSRQAYSTLIENPLTYYILSKTISDQ